MPSLGRHPLSSLRRMFEPTPGGSSQSSDRVQPKNNRPGTLLFFCLLIGCTNDGFDQLQGSWRIDIERTQSHLSAATHMQPQTQAALLLSKGIFSRHRFEFKEKNLTFGTENVSRHVSLEYKDTENKKRLVYRVSDSPFMMRVTHTETGLILDFEGTTWYLRRNEN